MQQFLGLRESGGMSSTGTQYGEQGKYMLATGEYPDIKNLLPPPPCRQPLKPPSDSPRSDREAGLTLPPDSDGQTGGSDSTPAVAGSPDDPGPPEGRPDGFGSRLRRLRRGRRPGPLPGPLRPGRGPLGRAALSQRRPGPFRGGEPAGRHRPSGLRHGRLLGGPGQRRPHRPVLDQLRRQSALSQSGGRDLCGRDGGSRRGRGRPLAPGRRPGRLRP